MRKKRYLHQLYRIVGVTFALLTLGCLCLLLLAPNEDYSEKEKRYLADAPKLSLQSLSSGTFMDEAEDYAKDRFPLRDAFVSLKVNLDRFFLKKESQGVYYLKDDALAERFTTPDKAALRSMLTAVRDFSDRTDIARQYFLLVPTAVSVKKDQLPSHALTDNQDAYMDGFFDMLPSRMEVVDVRFDFSDAKKDTKLYYASDHHWTTEGAHLAAEELLYAMGFSAFPEYESGVVANDFSGSLTAKSGFTLPSKDSITVFKEKNSDLIYTVTYEKEHRMTGTVYMPEALSGSDPYQVFFGGNYPEITINTSADSDRKLLILKDSYANALIPFLIPHFKQIKIIDPRYAYDDVDMIVKEGNYSDLLFLYNAVTLSEDTSLTLFLKGELPEEEGKQDNTDPSKTPDIPGTSENTSSDEPADQTDSEPNGASEESEESVSSDSQSDETESEPAESGSESIEPVPTESETENTEPAPTENESGDTDPVPTESDTENTEPSPSESPSESTDPLPSENTDPAPDTDTPPETEPSRGLLLQEAVFVGDSRTVFMGSAVINGVPGSQVMDDSRLFATYGGTLADASAASNAAQAGQVHAPAAFFWYGVNDVQVMPDRDDPNAFLERYAAMVDAYRREAPESRIIILSVASTSVNEKDYYPGQDENVRRYNEALSGWAAASGFNYIDVTPLVSEGSFLPDNIHFTNDFYYQLMPYLQEQLTSLTTP